MTEPDCEHCGSPFSHCPQQSVTRIWKCGTWSNHESGQGEQGIICREKELVRKVARLEAVVQWAYKLNESGRFVTRSQWSVPQLPDEVRVTIFKVLKAASAAGGE